MKTDLLTHEENTPTNIKLSKFQSELYYQDGRNINLNENDVNINHLDRYNGTGVVSDNEDQADLDVHKDSNTRENTKCPDKSQNTIDSNEETDQTNLSYNNTNNSNKNNNTNNNNTNINSTNHDNSTATYKNKRTNNTSKNNDDGGNKEVPNYEKDSKFVCVHCAQEFAGVRDYTRHMRKVHDEDISPYSCHLCPKKFKVHGCYKKHMHQHQTLLLHSSDHKCFVCSQEFTNALSLSKHQTTHYCYSSKSMASQSLCSNYDLQNVKIERTYVGNNQHTHEVSSERQSPQAHEQGFNHSSTTQAPTTAPSILSPQHHENSPDSLLNTDSKFELKNFPSSSSSYSHILNDLKVDRFINPSLKTNVTTRSQSKVTLVEGDNVIDNVKGKKVVIYYCLKCDKSYNRQLLYVEHLRVHAGLKPFCCEICGRMFARESNLAGHRQSHKQSKVYRCKVCKVKFSIKQKLVLHEMVHDMEEPFKCHLCIARFVRDPDLQEHLMTHSEYASKFGIVHTDQYEGCQQINQPIIEEIILDQNIISDSMDGQVIYSHMEIPESVYSSDGLLTNTISYLADMACSQQAGLMEDDDKERSFNANINQNTKTNNKTTKKKLYIDSNNTDLNTFTTINYISNTTTMQEAHSDNEDTNDIINDDNNNDSTNNDHTNNDHTNNDTNNNYINNDPNNDFNNHTTNDHSINDHPNNHSNNNNNENPTIAKNGERINDVTHYLTPSGKIRAYIFCEVCGQPYKLMREYHDHMRRHTGQKPYCCEVCGKTFHRSKNLSAHRYSHVEIKRHKCDVCGKCFPLSTRLKIHQRIHTGEKPYECELCQQRFIRRNDYMDHRRKHTGGNTCVHCNKKYSKLETLREHINDKHNKVKPIKCKLCDERFSYSVALYRHMKKHRGQEKDLNKKVHFCHHCQKAFTRPCLLNRHILKAHPQLHADEAATAVSE